MVRNLLLLVLIGLVLSTTAMSIDKDRKKCRALVLEGGGDKGSYQVGVLKAFVENMAAEEVMYDVVTGVSVGSINAGGMSLHEIGKEKDAVDWMYNLWSKLTAANIYESWPWGYVDGLAYEEGLWSNKPLLDFLTARLEEFEVKKIFRKTNIIAVDFDTGEVITYNETTKFEKLPQTVVASASMPFAFPHAHMDNRTLVDGGSVWNIDLSGALQRCMEVVSDPKDIIIDIIFCTGAQNVPRDEHKSWNTVQNYMRYKDIQSYYNTLNDYLELAREYKDRVTFRYLVAPKDPLPSGYIPLGFKHDQIIAMIDLGIKDGIKAIEDGEGQFISRAEELLSKGRNFV